MFTQMLRLEATKTFRRPFFWIGLCALAVLIGAFFALFFAFRANVPPSGTQLLYWPGSFIYGLGDAAGYTSETSFGTYLLITVVGIAMAQEYAWRTLQLWLSHGVSRPVLLGAKFALAIVPALLIVLLCLLVVGGLSALFSLQIHGTLDLAHLHADQLALSALRTTCAMLPYAALTFLLAVASRSAVVAVGGGLAFIAILETALANTLPLLGSGFARVVQYLPSGLASALNSQNYALAGLAVPHTALQPSPLAAFIGIAVYTLVFGGAALWIFQRQDLTN